TGRVDAFSPRSGRWRRLLDLPAEVNHAMAASASGRLYVAGGYGAERRAFVFFRWRWRALRKLPAPRAAGGAAIVGSKLYGVGGGRPGKNRLLGWGGAWRHDLVRLRLRHRDLALDAPA